MKLPVDTARQMVTVRASGPFDLQLSLAGADSFFPIQRSAKVLEAAIDVDGTSAVVTVRQPRAHSSIHASAMPDIERSLLRRTTKWLVSSDLDLGPFYRCVSKHPVMGPVAEYIRELAAQVANGALDLDALTRQSDSQIGERLSALRGFGDWSVQYILSRGFGRPDVPPSGDVGLRRVIGQYVAHGRTLTPGQLERALAAFKPFRGLAAYYLAVHWRLRLRKS